MTKRNFHKNEKFIKITAENKRVIFSSLFVRFCCCNCCKFRAENMRYAAVF